MKRLIASALGIGHFPLAPGTAGSLAAAVAAFGLHSIAGPELLIASLAAVTLCGFWSLAGTLEDYRDDPPWVVIDEVAGQLLALLPVSLWIEQEAVTNTVHMIAGWLAGVLLFRVFDIWKPWIVGRADRISGPVGIMLDDLLAGALAAVVLAGGGGLALQMGWIP